jgi:radical SAM superfamily enzyme YgiQ (UPF0313 family)
MNVLMIGFNVQEDIFPLGFSYLKGYASQFHPDVAFEIKEFMFGNRCGYDTNATIELQTISYVLMKKPDLVCFSCYIWNNAMIKNICRALKKLSNVKIAVGGVEIDDGFREHCDYLIKGEGELKFKEVIDAMKGASWSEEERIVENLDDIPFPYREYSGNKKVTVVRLETARGCPFKCNYCHYAEKNLREYSLEYLEKNIQYLFDNFEFKHLTITDGTFNIKKERMKKILGFISSCSKKVIVHCELKPELIDEDVVKIIKESGLRVHCELGLQSVDEDVLKACDRAFDLKKIEKALSLLNKSNIVYKIDMMYGLPKDTFFKFLRTANFIMKHSRQKQLPAHHFMVLNNTKYKHCVRYIENASSMIIQTDTQNALDFYKEKVFIDMINAGMREKYNKQVKK